jgi:predicted permease
MRARGFTLATLAAITIGIGAATAVLSVTRVVLYPTLPYPEPERLVLVGTRFSSVSSAQQVGRISSTAYRDWARLTQSFEGLAATRVVSATIGWDKDAQSVTALRCTSNLFQVLRVPPLVGRSFIPDDERDSAPPVALISDSLWRSRFGGTRDIAGTQLKVNGTDCTIVDVLPHTMEYPRPGVDVWIPFIAHGVELKRDMGILSLIGRLKPNVPVETADQDVNRALASLKASGLDQWVPGAVAVGYIEFSARPVKPALVLLMVSAAALFLIGLVNVTNLVIARSADRNVDTAVRVALGCSPAQLAGQLALEAAVLATLGGIAGLALADAALGYVARTAGASLPRATQLGLDRSSLLISLLFCFMVALIYVAIAIRSSAKRDLSIELKAGARSGVSAHTRRFQQFMMAVQFALAITVLISAVLLVRSFRELIRAPLGFNPAGLVALPVALPAARYPNAAAEQIACTRIVERLAAIPGVQAAAGVHQLPIIGFSTYNYAAAGQPADAWKSQTCDYRVATEDYHAVIGARMLQGRNFTAADESGKREVCIVSESLARKIWPDRDAVGQKLYLEDETERLREVIGVVGDIKNGPLEGAPSPTIYVPLRQNTYPMAGRIAFNFVVRTDRPVSSILPDLRETLRTFDPGLTFSAHDSLEEIVDRAGGGRRLQAWLVVLFAVAASVLSVVGVYGVTARAVAVRSREFAIRMALGSTRAAIAGQVFISVGVPFAMGTVLGWVSAALLSGALAKLVSGISATDPLTFIVAPLVFGLAAALACLPTVIRAVTVDAATVLRDS